MEMVYLIIGETKEVICKDISFCNVSDNMIDSDIIYRDDL